MSNNNKKLKKSRRSLARRAALLFLVIFIIGQLIIFPLMYYDLLIKPKHLGTIEVEMFFYKYTMEKNGTEVSGLAVHLLNEHWAFDDAPKGLYVELTGIYVGIGTKGYVSQVVNASDLLKKQDRVFIWALNHVILRTKLVCFTGSAPGDICYYDYINGTLKDYVDYVGKWRSKIANQSLPLLYFDVFGFSTIENTSEVNIMYIENRFLHFWIDFAFFQIRDYYTALEDMTPILQKVLPVDIYLGVVFNIHNIGKGIDFLGKLLMSLYRHLKQLRK